MIQGNLSLENLHKNVVDWHLNGLIWIDTRSIHVTCDKFFVFGAKQLA